MSWAYLQSDGMIISCAAHNSNPDFDLGNIKSQSFKQIWWGDKRSQHIEFMKNFDISVCRKNCRMHNVNEVMEDLKDLSGQVLADRLVKISPLPLPRNTNFI